jgi:hypothetical protein
MINTTSGYLCCFDVITVWYEQRQRLFGIAYGLAEKNQLDIF